MAGKRVMMIGLDGADPFVIKKMIDMGRLPNIKKAIENGVIGDKMAMIGAFPSVTPPNWASLAVWRRNRQAALPKKIAFLLTAQALCHSYAAKEGSKKKFSLKKATSR